MYIYDRKLAAQHPQAAALTENIGDNLKNKNLGQSLFRQLCNKERFGHSKIADKKQAVKDYKEECKTEGKSFRYTDVRLDGIYSYSTFKNYFRVGVRFIEYATEQGFKGKSIEKAVERYGKDYIRDMEARGLSTHSMAQAKSFMGKILGKELDIEVKKGEPEKGRTVSQRVSLFREDLNKDLVTIAKGTGGRRSDLERLEVKNFIRDKGIVVAVRFEQSKGGRDRISPILPQYQKDITNIVAERERTGQEKVFDRVNSMANIHAYRREYARDLYNYCNSNKDYKERMLDMYRAEEKTLPRTYNEEYKAKDGRVFDRESLFVSSQALGHNRLDVICNSYFK